MRYRLLNRSSEKKVFVGWKGHLHILLYYMTKFKA